LLGAISLGVVACIERAGDAEAQPECALPADAVSPELLAFLSKARASHLRADLAVADDETDVAIAALDDLLDGPLPAGAPSPETREVLADTLARTAELRSSLGQFDEARADIEHGLALATETTHYRGRLKEVLGAVEERQREALLAELEEQTAAGAGEAELQELTRQADAAKQRAIKASLEAIDIQEEVIDKALAEDPEAPSK
jgi:hypothetical protein